MTVKDEPVAKDHMAAPTLFRAYSDLSDDAAYTTPLAEMAGEYSMDNWLKAHRGCTTGPEGPNSAAWPLCRAVRPNCPQTCTLGDGDDVTVAVAEVVTLSVHEGVTVPVLVTDDEADTVTVCVALTDALAVTVAEGDTVLDTLVVTEGDGLLV